MHPANRFQSAPGLQYTKYSAFAALIPSRTFRCCPPPLFIFRDGAPNSRQTFVPSYYAPLNQEKFSKYSPGGVHPGCIGDVFKRGQYKIHHKLGWGGFSTVWLARDKQYVAPKYSATH